MPCTLWKRSLVGSCGEHSIVHDGMLKSSECCNPPQLLLPSSQLVTSFLACFSEAPMMLLSRFAHAASSTLPSRLFSVSLVKPLLPAALFPRQSPNALSAPAPRAIQRVPRSFATSSCPQTPPASNPPPHIHQPTVPASAAFMRSSVFWGDTKAGNY